MSSDQPQTTGPLAEHDAQPYLTRTCRERAIAAFIGRKGGEPGWCVSVAEVREFIARSPLYQPLLAAMKELQDA